MDNKPPPSYNEVTGIHQPPPTGWQVPPMGPLPTAHQYPPSGYPYPQPPPYQTYGTTAPAPDQLRTTVIVQPEVIIVGGCPSCRVGVLEDYYGCCALMCAIVFFPLGVLLCLLMKERRCSHCGAVFD